MTQNGNVGGSVAAPKGGPEPGALILHLGSDPLWRILAATEMRERGHRFVGYESAAKLGDDDGCAIPDLIIIDVAAAQVEGLGSCTSLRRHPRFSDSPVLARLPGDAFAILLPTVREPSDVSLRMLQ